jgi:hypothetical protein
VNFLFDNYNNARKSKTSLNKIFDGQLTRFEDALDVPALLYVNIEKKIMYGVSCYL